jgi:hypothetical protein
VVERYLPLAGPLDFAEVVGLAAAAAKRARERGEPVRYVHSTLLPSDEMCFCLFEGPSADSVRRANELVGLTFERVVEGRLSEGGERRG